MIVLFCLDSIDYMMCLFCSRLCSIGVFSDDVLDDDGGGGDWVVLFPLLLNPLMSPLLFALFSGERWALLNIDVGALLMRPPQHLGPDPRRLPGARRWVPMHWWHCVLRWC